MKKNLFMVAAVALLAMVACNKEDANNDGAKEPSYYVEFTADLAADDTAVDKKTAYDPDNKKTKWTDGDLISVNGKKFEIKELSEDGLTARFVNAEELGDDFAAPYTAVYPYNSELNTAVVPAQQTLAANTFANGAVVAAAYSTEKTLSFLNVCSVIKFQVEAACEKVTISSDNELAGTLVINGFVYDDPETETNENNVSYEVTDPETTITATCDGGFETGVDYYVAVMPGVKNNFKVRVDDYYSKGADEVTINRSKVANMKVLPEPLRKVYVKNDLNWEELSLYAWTDTSDGVIGTWPGTTLSETEVIDGNTYYVYDFKDVAGVITGVIINGTASNGSKDVGIQTANIEDNLQGNKYYRLSIRNNLYKEIDPTDLTTFGFRIYVYMQGNSDDYVDPYLHVWSTEGITDTDWNSQKKITDKYEYPGMGNKTFYYYEPPTQAYSSMNFIVTLQTGSKQTGDIKGALKSDYYVCAWANSGSDYGLYARKGSVTKNNNDINASTIGIDPELCY